MKFALWAALLLSLMIVPAALFARPRFIEDGPQLLKDTRSLGDVIRASDRPVHVSFVHGMRSEGPGNSDAFRTALIARLGGTNDASPERRFLDLGARPLAELRGQMIWPNDQAWAASRPFVDRYELSLGDGKVVIVDEVNWWPLLFPLKCRYLLLAEHHLAGTDAGHLRLCAREDPPFHRWISQSELDEALSARPRSGGGARINRSVKHEIMNWGLSDAVIALGPMRRYIGDTMEQAFAFAEDGAHAQGARHRVIVAESLGGFAVLDSAGRGSVEAYLAQTNDLYFFANQFALLELARIGGIEPRAETDHADSEEAEAMEFAAAAGQCASAAPLCRLAAMARRSVAFAESGEAWSPTQVIALSDPSDLLTYRVPALDGVKVVNVYVRNSRSFLGLFAHPVRAHTGHAANRAVWEVLIDPRGAD